MASTWAYKCRWHFSELRQAIDAVLPTYFTALDDEFDGEHDSLHPAVEDETYLTVLKEFLNEHQHTHAGQRSHLTDEKQVTLTSFEMSYVEAIDEHFPDIQNIVWHYRLKNRMTELWRAAWHFPTSTTLHLLWDHMAPPKN